MLKIESRKLFLEIWYCDPEAVRREGASGTLISGCGFIMLQSPDSDKRILICPACEEAFCFQKQPLRAELKVVPDE